MRYNETERTLPSPEVNLWHRGPIKTVSYVIPVWPRAVRPLRRGGRLHRLLDTRYQVDISTDARNLGAERLSRSKLNGTDDEHAWHRLEVDAVYGINRSLSTSPQRRQVFKMDIEQERR